MRFNKQELMTLATQPSQEFDKEGVLFLRERQDGFFRRTEILLERWCRLKGNLLFYFKSKDLWSEPVGVVILEQFTVKIDPPSSEPPYGFTIAFEGGLGQYIGASTEGERDDWIDAIQKSGYYKMRARLRELEQKLELKRGHDPDLDVHMWRLRRGSTIGGYKAEPKTSGKKEKPRSNWHVPAD